MKTNIPDNENTLNSYIRLLAAIFFAGLSFGVSVLGVWQGFNNTPSHSHPKELPYQTKLVNISRAEYERLKLGMPLDAVEAILGQGIEISRTSTMATFIWENPDGSNITVIFDSDKLKSKSQSGLK